MKKLLSLLLTIGLFSSTTAAVFSADSEFYNSNFDYTINTQGLTVVKDTPGNVVTFTDSEGGHWVYQVEVFNDGKTTVKSIMDDFVMTQVRSASEEFTISAPLNLRIRLMPFKISTSLKGVFARILPAHDYGNAAVAFEQDGKVFLISGDSHGKFMRFVKSFRFGQ